MSERNFKYNQETQKRFDDLLYKRTANFVLNFDVLLKQAENNSKIDWLYQAVQVSLETGNINLELSDEMRCKIKAREYEINPELLAGC